MDNVISWFLLCVGSLMGGIVFIKAWLNGKTFVEKPQGKSNTFYSCDWNKK